jgi:hypothetical protein
MREFERTRPEPRAQVAITEFGGHPSVRCNKWVNGFLQMMEVPRGARPVRMQARPWGRHPQLCHDCLQYDRYVRVRGVSSCYSCGASAHTPRGTCTARDKSD